LGRLENIEIKMSIKEKANQKIDFEPCVKVVVRTTNLTRPM